MALRITINKVAVADSFAAGTKVANIVVSGGTSPYSYSLASGGDYFQISGTEVQVINEMDISNIQSFSVTATDSTSGTALTVTSEETYPNLTAEIQSRFNFANKIYKITQDIDLGHGVLTIPSGCTLDFQGGSLSNGTLEGNNTSLQYKDTYIFGDKLFIDGTWNVPTIKDSMFYNLQYINSINEVFKLTNPNVFNTVILSNTSFNYEVEVYVDDTPAISLNSNTYVILNSTIQLVPNSFRHYRILSIEDCDNVKIEGTGNIFGDKDSHIGTAGGEWGHGIRVKNSNNIIISGITVENCWGDSISAFLCTKVTIQNCILGNSRRQGISIGNGDVYRIIGCTIHDISGTAPQSAIDIEPNEGESVQTVEIKDNIVTDCVRGIMAAVGNTTSIDTILIKNNVISASTLAVYLESPTGITSDYHVKTISIENNYIKPIISGAAIQIRGASQCNISNNTLIQTGQLTLNLTQGDNFIVKGNYIYNPSGAAVRILNNTVLENNNITANMFTDLSGSNIRTIQNSIIRGNILNTAIRMIAKNVQICNNYISTIKDISYLMRLDSGGEFNIIDGNIFINGTFERDAIIYNVASNSIFTNNIFNIGEGLVSYVFNNVGDKCIFSKNRINGTITSNGMVIGSPVDYYNSSYEEDFVKSGSSQKRPQIIPYSTERNYATRGVLYFDTALNKPIWWTGSEWITAGGSNPEKSVGRNEDWTLTSKVTII